MLRLMTIVVLAAYLLGATVIHADTLGDIRKSGVFKIGYRNDIPPFASIDENGDPHGFSIDLCKIIASKVGEHIGTKNFSTEFVRLTSANRLDAVASGRVHIECGITTNTLSRQEIVDFSNLFYVTGASLMTTATSGVENVTQLGGKRLAVVANTTTLKVLRSRLEELMIEAKLEVVDSHADAMKLLEEGKVDVVAGDRAILLGLGFASSNTETLRLTVDMLSFEPYAFPVPRNDADYRLVVNRALSDIYLSGQIGTIWQKWFGGFSVKPTQLLLTLYRLNSMSE